MKQVRLSRSGFFNGGSRKVTASEHMQNARDKSRTDVSFYQVNNLSRKTQLADRMEVARTSQSRSKGLLGRAGLESGEALWIVPCEAVHTFWMRFTIDLVYIDKQYRVRKVRSSVPPWRLSACLTAHSIIELPAGVVLRSQTQPGDQLEFIPALK
jgi:uncharacterized protein